MATTEYSEMSETNTSLLALIAAAAEHGECPSCLTAGQHRPATTRSANAEWAGYELCEECAAEYDSRA